MVVEPTHLKNMLVKLDQFPKDRGENQKCLKPQPRPSKVRHWSFQLLKETNLSFPWQIHGTGIFAYIYHKNQPNVGIVYMMDRFVWANFSGEQCELNMQYSISWNLEAKNISCFFVGWGEVSAFSLRRSTQILERHNRAFKRTFLYFTGDFQKVAIREKNPGAIPKWFDLHWCLTYGKFPVCSVRFSHLLMSQSWFFQGMSWCFFKIQGFLRKTGLTTGREAPSCKKNMLEV